MAEISTPNQAAPAVQTVISELHGIRERLEKIELHLARAEGQALHKLVEKNVDCIQDLMRWRAWMSGGMAVLGSAIAGLAFKVLLGGGGG